MKPVALLLLLLAVCFTSGLQAQGLNGVLSGTIRSEKGEALSSVNISLKEYPIGTTSDPGGQSRSAN
jgi:hypothetical protein